VTNAHDNNQEDSISLPSIYQVSFKLIRFLRRYMQKCLKKDHYITCICVKPVDYCHMHSQHKDVREMLNIKVDGNCIVYCCDKVALQHNYSHVDFSWCNLRICIRFDVHQCRCTKEFWILVIVYGGRCFLCILAVNDSKTVNHGNDAVENWNYFYPATLLPCSR